MTWEIESICIDNIEVESMLRHGGFLSVYSVDGNKIVATLTRQETTRLRDFLNKVLESEPHSFDALYVHGNGRYEVTPKSSPINYIL